MMPLFPCLHLNPQLLPSLLMHSGAYFLSYAAHLHILTALRLSISSGGSRAMPAPLTIQQQ